MFHLKNSISIESEIIELGQNVLVTTIALVKDSGTFVCTSQLLSVVAHFLATTLFTTLGNDTGCVHVIFGEGLDL